MFVIHAAPPNADALAKQRRGIRIGLLFSALVFVGALWFLILVGHPLWSFLVIACSFTVGTLCLSEQDALSDVPDTRCAALLQACLATEEGRVYRQAVLEQGRNFVIAELAVIELWAQGAETRAQCKQLYDIAQ
jgi:hypothetical protein